MLRCVRRWARPRDNFARAFCGEKVGIAFPTDPTAKLSLKVWLIPIYKCRLDKCVTTPIGSLPDAAGRLPLLARSGADSRPGFAPVGAGAAAVWLAGGRIPGFARRPGSLPPAVGDGRSSSPKESVPARRKGTGGSWKNCRLLAFELDGTGIPANASADLRSARASLCPR